METKIKVIDVLRMSNKNIFEVTIVEGTYLIGDRFINSESDLKFELKGVAMENDPEGNLKAILVNLNGEYNSIDEFKNKLFIKMKN